MHRTTSAGIAAEIEQLSPWFHNLHLPDGTQTAPRHFLGDFPRFKWNEIKAAVPENLSGWNVLDIGCNAGFYALELARRGATVTALDLDPHYLRQARWAARQFGLAERIEVRQQQLYELARTEETFDLVWFMGVFYHLRYPLLALDIVARLTKRLLVFQTMTLPGDEVVEAPPDLSLHDRATMRRVGWPMMAFIEKRLAGDPTNWWAANHACVEAMLRSSGFRVLKRPAHETYICEPGQPESQGIDHLLEQEYHAAIGRHRSARQSDA